MRQVSSSIGNCLELGLLVNSFTWFCIVLPETLSSVYLMIEHCMRRVFFSIRNSMELGLLVNSCTWVSLVLSETLSSVYLMICAHYETGILFYRQLHGTETLSNLSCLDLSCAT
jgi:hypothetical protein